MAEEKGNSSELEALNDQLRSMAYVGGRAIDALDLIKQSSFQGSDAVKVAQATQWLENVAKDVSRQAEAVQEKITKLAAVAEKNAPAMEVVSPEAVSAAQDQAAGEAPAGISEAADLLK